MPRDEPHRSEPLRELVKAVRTLAISVESLDNRAEQWANELQTQLTTMLEALALVHDDDPGARRRLRELRTEPDYEAAFTAPQPLVSIVIPTWTRLETLLERAIPSALSQSYSNIEVIVVGDASPHAVAAAVTELDDPRVAFHNLTTRGPYAEDRFRAWLAAGTPPLNAGIALARGQWLAFLGDDDAFVPQHVERLLAKARAQRLEFVYGKIRQRLASGEVSILGQFPPRLGQIGLQAAVYHAGLSFLELELGHALFGTPNDWGLVQRMMRIGVRTGMVDDVSVDYFPSRVGHEAARTNISTTPPDEMPEAPTPVQAEVARLQRRVADLQTSLLEERQHRDRLDTHDTELMRRLDELGFSRSRRLTAPVRRLLERRLTSSRLRGLATVAMRPKDVKATRLPSGPRPAPQALSSRWDGT